MRIYGTALFKKRTESRWSNEVHVVQSASEKSVILQMEQHGEETKQFKNNSHGTNTEKHVIRAATKQHADKIYIKREGIN